MKLNVAKLDIYFYLIKQTQGEQFYTKMINRFSDLVIDYGDELLALGVEQPGYKAYIKTVDMLVEIYENKYPVNIVNMVNEMASAEIS